MNIIKNDKVILKKQFGDLNKIGQAYEVANITDTQIVLREIKSKIAVAAIDFAALEEYFQKSDSTKSAWTNWTRLVDEQERVIAWYRTNQKKVQVKTEGGYRSEASCNRNEDEFDLHFGIRLAFLRLRKKFLNNYLREVQNVVVNIAEEQKQIDKAMNSMIDSLDK